MIGHNRTMDASQPLVSIGIPAYKTAYLGRVIDSCLGQTYRNVEVVIAADCSPFMLYGFRAASESHERSD